MYKPIIFLLFVKKHALGTDMFLAKYNSNGDYVWAKQAKKNIMYGDALGYGLDVDSIGNCYITGYYNDTIVLDTDTLIFEPDGRNYIFITKFNSDGNVLWATRASVQQGSPFCICSDKLGNCYISTNFAQIAVFGIDTITHYYWGNIIAKYNNAGNYVSRIKMLSAGDVKGRDMCVDKDNNLHVTGSFAASTSFGSDSIIDNIGIEKVFIAKYSSNGNCIWAKQAGTINGYDSPNAISLDDNANLYITGGNIQDTTIFGNDTLFLPPDGESVYIAKYDSSGNMIWVKLAEGNNGPFYARSTDICVDNIENIYVIGEKGNPAGLYFDNDTLVSPYADAFIAKLYDDFITNIPKTTINADNSIFIYPNPAINFITVEAIQTSKESTITICNINGQEIIKQKIKDSKTQININNLTAGVYIVKFTNNKTVEVKKIIKE